MRCRRERSFTEEIMEPLDSNVSTPGAVWKREMMQRIAVSVYLRYVKSVKIVLCPDFDVVGP